MKVQLLIILISLEALFVIGNRDEIVYFLNRVLRCVESLQQDPGDERCFRELNDHTIILNSMLSMVRSREGPDGETVVFLQSICFCFSRLCNFRTRPRNTQENCLPPVPPTARLGIPCRPRYDITVEQFNWGNLIDPLMNDGNHGIQLFLSLLHFLQARHPRGLSE